MSTSNFTDKQSISISSSHNSSTKRTVQNQKWILKQRPNGAFHPKQDVELVTEDLILSSESCNDDNNEVIVKVDVLSVDAFIRTQLDEESYHGSVSIGNVIPAIGFGTIVYAGRNVDKKFQKEGTIVQGMLGAQTYAVVSTKMLAVKPKLPFVGDTASLGLVGLTTGLTAYSGIFYVTNPPKKGETIVVTAASGAVGSIASQLAKSTGARVVGIAGGEKKKAFLLDELKLDGAIDYKHPNKTIEEQLDEQCPNGVDFFYDNVGGEILDAVLNRINPNGRVVICGAISQYSGNLNKGKVRGPSNYLKLAERGATMKGFNVMQYMSKFMFATLWLIWYNKRGYVHMYEHIENGIASFSEGMDKMFHGGHVGKLLVDLRKESE